VGVSPSDGRCLARGTTISTRGTREEGEITTPNIDQPYDGEPELTGSAGPGNR
jgi:hypothetical protein